MCQGVWEMGSKMFDLMYIHTYLKTLAGEQKLLDIPAADNCQVD